MTITFTPLPSLAPARSYASGLPMCAKWQGINGSTAWTKPVFHTVTMRTAPGSP
jgi:hypothetical protein